MPFFRSKPLPTTSYGYEPPPEATAHGWHCPECGRSEWEPVKRWPRMCECGSRTDPLFDEPWGHNAYGVELRWNLANGREDGGFSEDQLPSWLYKDAMIRGDFDGRGPEARCAAAMQTFLRRSQLTWWNPKRLRLVDVRLIRNEGR